MLGGGSALADAPVLRAYLLGGFRVEVQGRVLGEHARPRKKARQLLKCLLTRPNRRMLKEELLELLWPESEPRAAAASLRTTLSAMRQALQPVSLIVADQDSLGLPADA